MAKKPSHRGTASLLGIPGFVAYYRVSTAKQGQSGLGLEAQREAVERHVRSVGGTVLAEFIEIESGKKNNRPEVARAIAACGARRATLVIAKLDRLARNVAFVSNLMEAGVEFVACDNPFATRLTVHILAAVAEHEREMISARTTAALAAARARGTRLGNPALRAGDAEAARRANAACTAPGSLGTGLHYAARLTVLCGRPEHGNEFRCGPMHHRLDPA
ncbi:recombinase family protein [Siccirubricoccus sp. G192]|nr:recombinase family protein [Siccirubricoccus sp. G192]MBV1800407.1 recombinase family protein [Siccirubricoccus sp. G192]